MWPDDEKAAENTCRIVKGFEEVWTHFCPPKPCFPLSTDTTLYHIDSVKKEDFVNVRGILTPPEAGKTAWYMTIM